MFTARGVSKTDAALAASFVAGVEATLKRVKASARKATRAPLGLGQMFELARLHDDASRAYCKAMDDKDESVALEALARYVIVKLKEDRRAEALTHAERLAARDPVFKVTSVLSGEVYTSMTLLGDALFVNERFAGAEKAYQHALETLPGDPYVSGRLALLHLAQGEEKGAVRLGGPALTSPRYAELADTLKLVESGLVVGRISPAAAISLVVDVPAGRPFRVEQLRTAQIVERDDWS